MAAAEAQKELFIHFGRDGNQKLITAVYTVEPSDPDISYTRMCFKTEDIPFLRITRMSTYNEDEMYGGLILHIQYLHYKGLALDVHPEVGTLPQKWIHNKSIENGYFDDVTPETIKYVSTESIRVVKDSTSCLFPDWVSHNKSNAIQFEKVSSVPLQLDVYNESGFFVEYPAETKLYGLIPKYGLESYNTAQANIIAFGRDPAILAQLDTSEMNCPDEPKYRDCVVRELLAINWLGEIKPGFRFYATQNQYGCEGVIYTDQIHDKEDIQYSSNPIEMNIIYPDGTINA